MNFNFKKLISGDLYEKNKQYFKCCFPKGANSRCHFIGTINEVKNHIATVHLKHSRYFCHLCEEQFVDKIQYSMHKSRKKCTGLLDTDLREKEFDQNAEVIFWRAMNVFIRQLMGSELTEYRTKQEMARKKKTDCRMTPYCTDDNEFSSANDTRNIYPQATSFPVLHVPVPESSVSWRSNFTNNQPPVAPYRPPPNYLEASANKGGQSFSSNHRDSRFSLNSNQRGRPGRSASRNNAPKDDPTGTVSLRPRRPQEMRHRSVSRVRYHDRGKSPMRNAVGAGEIESTLRLKASFRAESRGTAKVPNMRNNRNACLLGETVFKPNEASMTAAKREAMVAEKLARNKAYQDMQNQMGRRSSRSRSPINR